jgi:hypothetical protein
MGATAAIAGVTMLGAYLEGASAKEEAGYKERIANANAEFAEAQARRVLQIGEQDAQGYGKKIRQTVGSQRAALAAQGVDVSSGSAAELQAETFEIGARDIETIKNNAFLEAYGLRVQAEQDRQSGRLAQRAADNIARNSLITGGLRSASMFYDAAPSRTKAAEKPKAADSSSGGR